MAALKRKSQDSPLCGSSSPIVTSAHATNRRLSERKRRRLSSPPTSEQRDAATKTDRRAGHASSILALDRDESTEDVENGVSELPTYLDYVEGSVEALEPGPSSPNLTSIRLGKELAPTEHGSLITPWHFTAAEKATLTAIVDAKLRGRLTSRFRGYDEERAKVNALLAQTIEAGEGNSLLLIGPHGCGKSRIVQDALDTLSAKQGHRFHVVKLNGLIHTDDKLALREIWRQLGKDLEENYESSAATNYSDALAKLLAVLSHPAELGREDGAERVADAVVFVLDEFELFTTHARQTLLYNLFDIAQSRKAPIAVLGLTSKVGVVDMLEKRVRSRFSHRYVFIRPHDYFPAFKESCLAAMSLSVGDMPGKLAQIPLGLEQSAHDSPPKRDTPRKLGRSPRSVREPVLPAETSPTERRAPELIGAWNAAMERLLEREDIASAISSIFHSTKSYTLAVQILRTSLFPSDQQWLPIAQPPDSKLMLLPQLSTLALTLLICAARLEIILAAGAGAGSCNLAMAYDEYTNLVSQAKIAASVAVGSRGGRGDHARHGEAGALRLWSQSLARDAWCGLIDLELLIPVTGAIGPQARVVGQTDTVRCDVALEEIVGAVPELDRSLLKWCKEI